jgi:hypothetical protein
MCMLCNIISLGLVYAMPEMNLVYFPVHNFSSDALVHEMCLMNMCSFSYSVTLLPVGIRYYPRSNQNHKNTRIS